MVVLIDTNILIDFFARSKREAFAPAAKKVMKLVGTSQIDGYVSAHSIMDLCYMTRKERTHEERLQMIQRLSRVVRVADTTLEAILAAARNENFKDFEDSVVNQAAVTINADYIVTRDTENGHFKHSDVPTITPDDFIKLFETKEQAE